jgi:hypothetical protein
MSRPIVYIVLRKKLIAAPAYNKGEFCSVFGKREDAYTSRDHWNRQPDGYVYFIVTTPVL